MTDAHRTCAEAPAYILHLKGKGPSTLYHTDVKCVTGRLYTITTIQHARDRLNLHPCKRCTKGD